jgi:hypothetical protein
MISVLNVSKQIFLYLIHLNKYRIRLQKILLSPCMRLCHADHIGSAV